MPLSWLFVAKFVFSIFRSDIWYISSKKIQDKKHMLDKNLLDN